MAALEKECKWHFAEHLGGREDGPNDPMSDNFKKTPYASLIRESIQNSLDVPLDTSSPVRMEFSIGRIRAKEYPNFFDLIKHIEGCIEHFKGNTNAMAIYKPMLQKLKNLQYAIADKANLYYIKVSDYNTQGMNYCKDSRNNAIDDTTQPFYAFVRAAGVSSKGDTSAGGSFGYGKAAYFYISPIRTIFVSTQTKENKHFFEGVSSLCTHEIKGESVLRVSVGYYDNNNGYPITDTDMIPAKFQRNEPGTDIFILGIDASDRGAIYEEMTEAILRNFWMAIESKKLEVRLNATDINYDTLPELMDEYFPDEHDTKKRETSYNPRPYWEAVRYAGTDSQHLIIKKCLPIIGNVSFFLIKRKDATDKVLYMRKPRMLVKARRTKSSYGFYGVFICDDPKGNELLRATENPAHDEWKSGNWRVDGRIVSEGREAIEDVDKFIIDVMTETFSNKQNTIQQIQGLDEFLYIPTAVEDETYGENDSLIGDIVYIQEEESDSVTTDLSNPYSDVNSNTNAYGKIMKTDSTSIHLQTDSSGGLLSGHGKKKKKKKGGGGLSGNNVEGRYSETEDGIRGGSLKEIPVRYRTFAEIEDGKVIHNIIIHSDYALENGRIDLLVGGEQSDDKVAISSCFGSGQIEGNSICGLKINIGKNILRIKFADNMKHAIKLDAYELK